MVSARYLSRLRPLLECPPNPKLKSRMAKLNHAPYRRDRSRALSHIVPGGQYDARWSSEWPIFGKRSEPEPARICSHVFFEPRDALSFHLILNLIREEQNNIFRPTRFLESSFYHSESSCINITGLDGEHILKNFLIRAPQPNNL